MQVALVLDRDASLWEREVDARHPPTVHHDVVVQPGLWETRPGQHEPGPRLTGRAGSDPDLSEGRPELHDAATAAATADRGSQLRQSRPAEPTHQGVAGDDEFIDGQDGGERGEGVSRMREGHAPAVDHPYCACLGTVADGTADTKRLIRTDRRDVQPGIAFEAAGERHTEQHRGSRVTEHLVVAQPWCKCSCELVRSPRLLSTPDAVERATEIPSIETPARDPHAERATHPER